MDNSIKLIIFIICFSNAAYAKDFGIRANTFEIKEMDALEQIKNKLMRFEESGEFKKLQKKWQQKAKERVLRPKSATATIEKVIESSVRYFDPTIEVQEDLVDHKGRVFAKKGLRVNPFEKMPHYNPQLIFIDGDDEGQVEFAVNSVSKQGKIILVRGNIIALMQKHNIRLFFDQQGHLCKKFNLSKFPVILSREKKVFKIEEVRI